MKKYGSDEKIYNWESIYKYEKELIDWWKVLILLLASESANIFLSSVLENRTKERIDEDNLKRYVALIIRAIIVIQSINKDWPLLMCATISVVISIAIIITKLSQEK